MDSWFATVDLSVASVAERRVFDQIVQLLDRLQPARLNPADQAVVVEDGEPRIKLQHDSEPLLKIEIVLNERWVHFYGVMGHDEAYSTRAESADFRESETIDILSDLLQADYTIKTYELRGSRQRTVVDIGEPYNGSFTTPGSLLPWRPRATPTETRRASFECRNARSEPPIA